MEITLEQYKKIEKYIPLQRGNVSMDNVQLLNVLLYVAENGCKWRPFTGFIYFVMIVDGICVNML